MVQCQDIIDHLANAALLVDDKGRLIKINAPAASLLRSAGFATLATITKIDPRFKTASPEELEQPALIRIGKLSYGVRVFPAGHDLQKKAYIYLFEAPELLKIMDFDTFLDYIDVAVVVVNKDGVVEHLNNALSKFIGIDVKDWVGRKLQEIVATQQMSESVSLKVLKSKKAMSMNVSYASGNTVAYSSIPVYDASGRIKKVISTGRDVTHLLKLENDLHSSETLKERYYQRLNTLEVLLGPDRIVYSSEEMKRVIQVAIKAGKYDSPVLLWGESGVGKEMVAHLIHQSGKRTEGPFMAINCSTIPSELLESEFFGYEEGAFTGAKRGGQKGILDEAQGGTLFLDEISELPIGMQSKFLRVLQEKEYLRVGGTKAIASDVRVIASTNLTLEQLSDGSKFRRDLFYRLSVIPIHIPPLRQRREDILPLIRYFLKSLNSKYATDVRVAPSMVARLYNYDWPGNVRELRNAMERLIVLAGDDEISEAEYDQINQLEMHAPIGKTADISIQRLMPLKQAFQKVEELLIKRAYQESGSIEKAAQLLGIDPSTIHRKIKKGLVRVK